jgi:hypothetical protein
LSEKELQVVRNAGIVLLQREIPDSVNIQVAKVRNLEHLILVFKTVYLQK